LAGIDRRIEKARASGLFCGLRTMWYVCVMTRIEAITIINSKLTSLDDEKLWTVAEIVQSIDEERPPVRQLSARERGLLAQSRSDFAAGHSYSHEQLTELLDARLGMLGVPKSK
jgi:hypothetical protein